MIPFYVEVLGKIKVFTILDLDSLYQVKLRTIIVKLRKSTVMLNKLIEYT